MADWDSVSSPAAVASKDDWDAVSSAEAKPKYLDKNAKITPTEAALTQFTNMVPFGADALGAMAAVRGEDEAPSLSFSQRKAVAKQFLQEMAAQGLEQQPEASIAGGAGGVILPAMLTPQSWVKGASALERAVKGGIVAGGFGFADGFGKENDLDDRLSSGINNAVLAAPFGAGASVATDLASSAYRAASPAVKKYAGKLADRAKTLFSKPVLAPSTSNDIREAVDIRNTRWAPNETPSGAGVGVLNPAVADMQSALNKPAETVLTTPSAIPLTQGQLTQNPRQQALEFGAAAGNYGDDAQKMALEARELQSEAAKGALGVSPDDAVNSAGSVIDKLKSGYKSAKEKTSAAYKTVGDLTKDEPLRIAGTYVRETVIPSIQDWARKGSNGRAFDLGRQGMENAKRLYDQSTAFAKMDKVSALNFFRMEDWRSRVSQALAKPMIDPTEKAFLSGMLDRYDRAIQTLPREAIKSGDDMVIDSMEKARRSRKEQGVLFERSKLVKDILDNEDLTREQFANTLTSLGDKTGSYVKQIMNTARNNPQAKEAIREDIKKSVLGGILSKSMSAEVKAGTGDTIERMVSFDKLGTQLDKLVKNKTLLEQLYPDEAGRAAIEKIHRDVQLIKSTKPGTKNYSNSAYTLLNFLRTVSPAIEKANVLGIGAGTTLKAMGEGGATLELQKSLAPVLKNLSDEMTGPLTNFANKYGRQIAIEGASEIPSIEIRPLPKE